MLYRWASRLLFVAGSLLILAGTAYGGTIGYMMWRESVSPSTSQVLVLRDGRQIPLVQPTRPAEPVRETSAPRPQPQWDGTGNGSPDSPEALSPADKSTAPARAPVENSEVVIASASLAYLPPLRLKIAGIDVDLPVVLSNSKHMPKFKGIGWLMGSAYPGKAGNLVLFGHLDGPYATFSKLRQLAPGDEFTVTTESDSLNYKVTRLFDTPRDDVAVLAPTGDATATLITCSGQWDPVLSDYSHRLIVVAVLTPKR